MNIEDLLTQNTKAVQENTAVLREILESASAEALTTPAPKKKAKVKKEAPLAVIADEMPPADPPAPESEGVSTPTATPKVDETAVVVVVVEESEVPDLPIGELRAKLKEEIKGKLLADAGVKATFEALRQKFGVSVIKELTDEQVSEFYKEVLTW